MFSFVIDRALKAGLPHSLRFMAPPGTAVDFYPSSAEGSMSFILQCQLLNEALPDLGPFVTIC